MPDKASLHTAIGTISLAALALCLNPASAKAQEIDDTSRPQSQLRAPISGYIKDIANVGDRLQGRPNPRDPQLGSIFSAPFHECMPRSFLDGRDPHDLSQLELQYATTFEGDFIARVSDDPLAIVEPPDIHIRLARILRDIRDIEDQIEKFEISGNFADQQNRLELNIQTSRTEYDIIFEAARTRAYKRSANAGASMLSAADADRSEELFRQAAEGAINLIQQNAEFYRTFTLPTMRSDLERALQSARCEVLFLEIENLSGIVSCNNDCIVVDALVSTGDYVERGEVIGVIE